MGCCSSTEPRQAAGVLYYERSAATEAPEGDTAPVQPAAVVADAVLGSTGVLARPPAAPASAKAGDTRGDNENDDGNDDDGSYSPPLPDDVLVLIFLALGREDHLGRAAQVCRQWRDVAADPAVLRRFGWALKLAQKRLPFHAVARRGWREQYVWVTSRSPHGSYECGYGVVSDHECNMQARNLRPLTAKEEGLRLERRTFSLPQEFYQSGAVGMSPMDTAEGMAAQDRANRNKTLPGYPADNCT